MDVVQNVPMNNRSYVFSLRGLISTCEPSSPDAGLWARRCLADAIVPIWFREDATPRMDCFHMIRFRDEEHARLCCRGEASYQDCMMDLTLYEKNFSTDRLSPQEKQETISVLLVSGPAATFMRFPRLSMAFWTSIDERIAAYAKFQEHRSSKSWCAGCLTYSKDLKKCSSCKSARYCSQQCLRADRKQHKQKCRQISQDMHWL